MKAWWTGMLLFCGLQVTAQNALDSLLKTTQVITERWDVVQQMWMITGFNSVGDALRAGYEVKEMDRSVTDLRNNMLKAVKELE